MELEAGFTGRGTDPCTDCRLLMQLNALEVRLHLMILIVARCPVGVGLPVRHRFSSPSVLISGRRLPRIRVAYVSVIPSTPSSPRPPSVCNHLESRAVFDISSLCWSGQRRHWTLAHSHICVWHAALSTPHFLSYPSKFLVMTNYLWLSVNATVKAKSCILRSPLR